MTEKPVLMILPKWDPDEPRFVVKECPRCSDDRAFKNNKCVFNQRLGFAYSVDEIVEVLNNEDDFNQSNCITVQKSIICDLKKENEELKSDNDIKFWKLQFMKVHNSSQLIMHELSLAIDAGYTISDDFQKYLDGLKEQNKKNIEKAERLGI